jgi:hypothetical protein
MTIKCTLPVFVPLQGIHPNFDERGHLLECIIIWTDNAPNQYRCRQNFAQISSISENFPGIKIIHRLAVVDNLKENHDAVGKDPA